MANVAYPGPTGIVGKTEADTFIPEIWSDEVIAEYQKTLKMAPLVKRMSMKGKKGDLIHVPKPLRGTSHAKAENVAVTIQANVEEELTISINRHFEYSRFIEDIVDVQALSSLRREYTQDAGYQLAKKVDTDLFSVGTGFGDGTLTLDPGINGADWVNSGVKFIDASTGLTDYAVDTVVPADVFTDAGFRAMIKYLDDNDVPMDSRYFVIPPALRSALMGTDRYVSSDFRDPRTVQTGLIGNVYGVQIYVSSNCPVLETAAQNTASGATADVRGAFFFHKDAIVLAEQMAVRSQSQYQQEYLADLYTADTLYGVQAFRPEGGLVLATPDV